MYLMHLATLEIQTLLWDLLHLISYDYINRKSLFFIFLANDIKAEYRPDLDSVNSTQPHTSDDRPLPVKLHMMVLPIFFFFCSTFGATSVMEILVFSFLFLKSLVA